MYVVCRHTPKTPVGICAAQIQVILTALRPRPEDLFRSKICSVVYQFVSRVMVIEVVRHQNQMLPWLALQLFSDQPALVLKVKGGIHVCDASLFGYRCQQYCD